MFLIFCKLDREESEGGKERTAPVVVVEKRMISDSVGRTELGLYTPFYLNAETSCL